MRLWHAMRWIATLVVGAVVQVLGAVLLAFMGTALYLALGKESAEEVLRDSAAKAGIDASQWLGEQDDA